MADQVEIQPQTQRFIESMGGYFERYGISRIGGRILGLLLVADQPLSLDALANTLLVSRASISTNVRMLTATGLAELFTIPGDRRDYYRMTDDPWDRGLQADIDGIESLQRIVEQGLAAIGPEESAGRARLQQTRDFCDFTLTQFRDLLTQWRAFRASRGYTDLQNGHR